ncbi:hypothetical protein OOT55_13455 [Marinimicrobium sp. C6131]|uniref:hypothetical protein n=1 Tax=Marinimicrobium sp. C6131 TaxID=3022676 RepID=UPI00223E3FB5|nr:hypothetical protein [Marinimicrobium sp. C6131]UZJ43656.1 hypothetical protein OOT55_13455 [Marinimicrobium sp. C6131]
MISNFTELSETEYSDRRFNILVDVEENGDAKELPYVDSQGIPTIGVGFDLTVGSVRDEVLKAFGFDVNSENEHEQEYLQQIETALSQRYEGDTQAEKNDLLQSALKRAVKS